MGNCPCFKASSGGLATSMSSLNLQSTTTNQNADGKYTRESSNENANGRRQSRNSDKAAKETDELLTTRSPFKNSGNCDSKRNSFKKSLVLLNGGHCSSISDIITTAVNESMEISDNTLNQLFETYKDPDDPDVILAEGIERLCNDLNHQPEAFPILVLAWCLDASQMCRFTKTEFIEGLHKMRADTIETIRLRLQQTIEMLKVDSEMFKQLYRFTFRFGLEPDQRILPLDVAICLWRLVFTVNTPDLFAKWIDFLEKHPSIRGIPKDTWNMYLNFSEQCDIESYDDTEAWPSLFDDFVDYERARLADPSIGDIIVQDDDNNNDDPLQFAAKSKAFRRS